MNQLNVMTEGLTKIFRSRSRKSITAVKDLSFGCSPGKIFGLLGPNGAGKTTTLRMLSTMLTPTEGKAVVNGFDVRESPQKVRDSIGYLATETGLYERLTSKETLQFFGKINGLSSETLEERIREVSNILNMNKFLHQRVTELSSGMKQKLSLARSIIHDPPILLFDEPTFGLDVMTAKTVTDYIDQFRTEGKTIILSTHVMRVAEKLCDVIGILIEGKLETTGTLNQLLGKHKAEDLESVFFQLTEPPTR